MTKEIMGRFIFRMDGNQQQGMGHAIRSSALAATLRARGHDTHAVLQDSLPEVSAALRVQGMTVHDVPLEASLEDDAQELQRLVHLLSASGDRVAVILDGYAFTELYQRRVLATNALVVCMDDLAQGHFAAHLVLNPSLSATPTQYDREPYTELLLGPPYALIRPMFRAAARTAPQIPAIATQLLVIFGGADVLNQTRRVAELIDHAQLPCVTTLVVGPGYPHLQSLREWVASKQDRFVIRHHPDNLAHVISQAHVAISAAGSTCWELCCLGIPSVLMVVDDSQVGNANALRERGACVSLGWYHDVTDSQLAQCLGDLLQDQSHRQRLAEGARRIVDGLGAERVADALGERLAASTHHR